MSILDARTMGSGATVDADVCIVGAGAAGITLALELARTRRRICLVEAGGLLPDEETQSLNDLESIGQAVRENFMSRARYFGGTTGIWAGRSMRLRDRDLAPRPWVPESGWPLSASELDVWYETARERLRLPGLEHFETAAHARRMTEAEGRLFAGAPFAPTISLWAKRPLRFGATHRSALKKSKEVQVLLHANATALESDRDGKRVTCLRTGSLDGNRIEVRARHFVLAAGGLENARLLLVSRDRHPRGIGNQNDVVGRYYMDHPRSVFGRARIGNPHGLPLLKGLPLADGKVQFGIGLDPETQRREGLLNHYATFETEFSEYAEAGYGAFVRLMKILLRKGYAGKRRDLRKAQVARVPDLIYLLTPKELMPHALYRAFHALRGSVARRVRSRGPQTRIVVYYCEQPPLRESRVTLSDARDRLGVNRLVLDWRLGDQVTESLLALQEHLRVELEARGIGVLETAPDGPTYTDASHHIGTTRMSVDPRRGVVDPDGKVHGVANLFIAGSSVFPCAGHANPTLTIVALALRLGRHLGALG